MEIQKLSTDLEKKIPVLRSGCSMLDTTCSFEAKTLRNPPQMGIFWNILFFKLFPRIMFHTIFQDLHILGIRRDTHSRIFDILRNCAIKILGKSYKGKYVSKYAHLGGILRRFWFKTARSDQLWASRSQHWKIFIEIRRKFLNLYNSNF